MHSEFQIAAVRGDEDLDYRLLRDSKMNSGAKIRSPGLRKRVHCKQRHIEWLLVDRFN